MSNTTNSINPEPRSNSKSSEVEKSVPLTNILGDRYNFNISKEILRTSTPHQVKFFQHIESLHWDIKESDKSRFVKIYKDEAQGKKYAVSTDRVYSYLKDHPHFPTMEYSSQINLWFWLIHHGIGNNSENKSFL